MKDPRNDAPLFECEAHINLNFERPIFTKKCNKTISLLSHQCGFYND